MSVVLMKKSHGRCGDDSTPGGACRPREGASRPGPEETRR